MALDQSALLELLEALKAADADDVVRRAVESMFQVLIDAEATARIGAAPHERTPGSCDATERVSGSTRQHGRR